MRDTESVVDARQSNLRRRDAEARSDWATGRHRPHLIPRCRRPPIPTLASSCTVTTAQIPKTAHYETNLSLRKRLFDSPTAMPPRKKQRRAAPDTPQPEDSKQSAETASARDSAQKSDTEYDLVNDPWTDEQETALLKGLVRWKPVGSLCPSCARNRPSQKLTGAQEYTSISE